MIHDELAGHYLDLTEELPGVGVDELAELMVWRLTDAQVLDLACAALADDEDGLISAHHLALLYVRGFILRARWGLEEEETP